MTKTDKDGIGRQRQAQTERDTKDGHRGSRTPKTDTDGAGRQGRTQTITEQAEKD